jgi:predicted transposase YbfD/YdcC
MGGAMKENIRKRRRMAGVIKARLPDLRIDLVKDPRKARGKRWKLDVLLKTCVTALACRCKSLSQTEALSEEMGVGVRNLLGANKRVPDTTLRNLLIKLSPSQLRHSIHRQVKAAHRRKALKPDGLPFGVVAIDGKSVSIEAWDNQYAQRHRDAYGQSAVGLVRTLTCSLVSSRSKVCMDAVPIPAATNEMGHFQKAFGQLSRTFKGLFELVTSDAGMCSLENADFVIEQKKHYLFSLKQDQPTLLMEAKRLLAHQERPEAETEDVVSGYEVRRCLYLTEEMADYGSWRHLRTVLRIESVKKGLKSGRVVDVESRYFISSLGMDRLSKKQWLRVVREHWAVENQCHGTWDTAFEEDDRPWIRMNPQGTLVVMLLRRMAYNLLTLFRSVTQRSEELRQTPWKDIMRWMMQAVIMLNEQDVATLRRRKVALAKI